jgi:AAA15 family ATPase/GTPase
MQTGTGSMLLRFSVANFGSIRDEQQLSMIASKLTDDPSGLIETPALRAEKVLPAAVIYGANASGKSNLVRALAHMKELVRNSHRQGEPGAPIPLKPFLLDPAYAAKPSVFSIDFVWNGARYAYRFEALGNAFTQESLHVWRGGPVTLLFEREGQEFKFGRSLKGRNKVIEELTRPNSLFLSAAAQFNHEELGEVTKAFSAMEIDVDLMLTSHEISAKLANENIDRRVIGFLSMIDSGINDTKIFDEMSMINNMIGKKKIYIDGRVEHVYASTFRDTDELRRTPEFYEIFDTKRVIKLGHKAINLQTIYLDMNNESGGTLQLLTILGSVFQTLDRGGSIIIDEFGSQVHTRASEMIIFLFASKDTNPRGAQLIVTTHDTNLLNAPGLRRDQIWFTEKDSAGATHLYPLTDIETRKGDNLEKGYLQGRFGAIPFAGSAADLLKSS